MQKNCVRVLWKKRHHLSRMQLRRDEVGLTMAGKGINTSHGLSLLESGSYEQNRQRTSLAAGESTVTLLTTKSPGSSSLVL